MTQEYSNYLAHHGVLGMRWGVRRKQRKEQMKNPEYRQAFNDGRRSEKRRRRVKKLIKTAAVVGVTAFAVHQAKTNVNSHIDNLKKFYIGG